MLSNPSPWPPCLCRRFCRPWLHVLLVTPGYRPPTPWVPRCAPSPVYHGSEGEAHRFPLAARGLGKRIFAFGTWVARRFGLRTCWSPGVCVGSKTGDLETWELASSKRPPLKEPQESLSCSRTGKQRFPPRSKRETAGTPRQRAAESPPDA